MKVVEALAGGEPHGAVVDFSGVLGVSHSFADEFLAPLTEYFGEHLAEFVRAVNCADDVKDTFLELAQYDDLELPAFVDDDLLSRQPNDTMLSKMAMA